MVKQKCECAMHWPQVRCPPLSRPPTLIITRGGLRQPAQQHTRPPCRPRTRQKRRCTNNLSNISEIQHRYTNRLIYIHFARYRPPTAWGSAESTTRGIKSLNGDNYFYEKACELNRGLCEIWRHRSLENPFCCNCDFQNHIAPLQK